MAVMAVAPYTPRAENVLMSAWMPAPPDESEPAMERAMRYSFGVVGRLELLSFITIIISKLCIKNEVPEDEKKRIPPDRGMRYDIIHNSYGSTNCIRFEGIISAN
jgi:hypothetical protein